MITTTIPASAQLSPLEQRVWETIKSFGKYGCTSDDVRRALMKIGSFPYSSITARYAALQNKSLITRGPDKRWGDSGRRQLVMRAVIN